MDGGLMQVYKSGTEYSGHEQQLRQHHRTIIRL